MAVEEGKKAPAFTLADENGDKVRLSELAGNWVVLYFYPRDDTPGCTVEACDFTSGLKLFEKLGAKVYGCSPDSAEISCPSVSSSVVESVANVWAISPRASTTSIRTSPSCLSPSQ